jgi:hypothetical protein
MGTGYGRLVRWMDVKTPHGGTPRHQSVRGAELAKQQNPLRCVTVVQTFDYFMTPHSRCRTAGYYL